MKSRKKNGTKPARNAWERMQSVMISSIGPGRERQLVQAKG
jgi:hypothetical protein